MNDTPSRSPAERACPRCGALYIPKQFPIPTPGGGKLMVGDWYCPACQAGLEADRVRAEEAIIARVLSTGAQKRTRGDDLTMACQFCGEMFVAETEVWPKGGALGTIWYVKKCEACEEWEKKEQRAYDAMVALRRAATTPEERRRVEWVEAVGKRYKTFDRSKLPACILPHVDKVLAWTPRPCGIGLLGPTRTGKSPLIAGLGEQLFLAGHDVFVTSGFKFQQAVHRSVDDRAAWEKYLDRCENSEILLIDDADKLNFTPGVEAEYYGMLEHRRNWLLPVLCTLNLSGEQMKQQLVQNREDRAAAIVERLRDLCEFIAITTNPTPRS
jgi:DNA replication protein DnaC